MTLPICADLRDYADAFGDGYPALAEAADTIEALYEALEEIARFPTSNHASLIARQAITTLGEPAQSGEVK